MNAIRWLRRPLTSASAVEKREHKGGALPPSRACLGLAIWRHNTTWACVKGLSVWHADSIGTGCQLPSVNHLRCLCTWPHQRGSRPPRPSEWHIFLSQLLLYATSGVHRSVTGRLCPPITVPTGSNRLSSRLRNPFCVAAPQALPCPGANPSPKLLLFISRSMFSSAESLITRTATTSCCASVCTWQWRWMI